MSRGSIIGRTLGVVASALAVACGGAVRQVGPPAALAELRFANTSQSCSFGVDVTLEVAGERVMVPAGESVTLRVPAGRHAAIVRRAGRGGPAPPLLSREVIEVPTDPAAPAYFGCVAPEFVEATEATRPVEVVHHAFGCAPGRRGPALLSIGGRPFARVAPGRAVGRYLPAAAYQVSVAVRGRPAEARALLVDEGGGRLELGCPATAGAAAQLAALAIMGPGRGCATVGRRRARAAGVDVEVGPGESWTVFAPLGSHLVEVLGADGEIVDRLRVELGAGGAALRPFACR